MAEFTYTALNAAGKTVKGNIEANDQADAISKIKAMNVTPLKVDKANILNKDLSDIPMFEKKPKPKELAVFCRQMTSVISAGVPLAEALEMLSEQTENKTLAKAIAGCKKQLSGGTSLHEAMQEYKPFQGIFSQMIAAGEQSGNMEMAFDRMGERFEKDDKLKSMVKKASMYPIVLAVVTVIIIVVMLMFIVPKFQDLLGQLGTEMPALTQAIIDISEFLKKNFLWVGLGVALVVFAVSAFKKTDKGSHIFSAVAIKVPLFGSLTKRTACSNMARTMATLLAAGMPMLDCIEITANVMTNVLYKDAMLEIKKEVAIGTPLSEALLHTKLFPAMICHMTKIGEETGNLVGMFDKCANYYDEEVQSTTEQVTAAMEPMVIVVMAGIVGTIVIALLLPMLNMYSGMDSL